MKFETDYANKIILPFCLFFNNFFREKFRNVQSYKKWAISVSVFICFNGRAAV